MIAIGAIFKNEFPYILEWIAYHQVLGIKDFYIVDNISNDGSSELLCEMHKKGIITRIEHANVDGVKPQLPAYKKIIESLHKSCDFIAFIDADEFLRPVDLNIGLSDLMSVFNQDESVGAVAINWALYGSSNCIVPDYNSLVIERFEKRGNIDFSANRHYKTILRVSAISDVGNNPHYFNIKDEYKYVQTNSKEIGLLTGLSEDITWDKCRINHYVIKSKAEFFVKKASRGRAVGKNSDLNINFFNNHDINTSNDSYPYWFISRVKNNIDVLKSRLCSIINSKVSNISLYRMDRLAGHGCVDSILFENDQIVINGWAVDKNKNIINNFHMVTNNDCIISGFDMVRVPRKDVVDSKLCDNKLCGFKISVGMSSFVSDNITKFDLYAANDNDIITYQFNLEKFNEVFLKIFKNYNH